MSRIQSTSESPPRPIAATRPFTRAHNDLYDKIKPELYHKVDRCVLDALIRSLEGYHQIWVALTIPQLAELAAVSPWSVTQALARLVSSGVICRRKKKLTKAGRFIWEMSLAEAYRVAPPAMGSSHVTTACEEPMAMKEKPKKKAITDQHHERRKHQTGATDDASLGSHREDQNPAESTEGSSVPLTPFEPIVNTPRAAQPTAVESGNVVAVANPRQRPRSSNEGPRSKSALSPEQINSLRDLRSVGIDLWKARQLARDHAPALITQTVAGLKCRVGTIRNPAAWVVRELERGGYSPPPALADQAKREAKELQLRQDEERQAELARQQQQKTDQLLHRFAQLPIGQQEELVQRVREQLRQVSPRLASAPLELDSPGPVRSQLLELLEHFDAGKQPESRTAGHTPRDGGWEKRRKPGHPKVRLQG